MPTPPHAINNSIDTLGWPHSIVRGGRRKNSSKYANWRTEVEGKIKANGWQGRKDAGTDYNDFLLECVGLEDFPISGATLIRRTPQTDDTKPAHKALNELILDCFKKVRESGSKRRRAVVAEEMDAHTEPEGESDSTRRKTFKRIRYEDGRPVVVYILDPANEAHRNTTTGDWNWNVTGIKKLAVIYEASIAELHFKMSPHLPEGRKVREIIGALANASPDESGSIPNEQVPSDTTHIKSDDDMDAFLRFTEAKPIKLLIILHQKAGRENSAPPEGHCVENYYFKRERFDGREYYMDEVEDSDEEVRKRAGGKRGVPRQDHKWEERLEDIRRRVRRQNRHLEDMEGKHKIAHPDAIHERDPGGDLRLQCYGPDDELSGKQVVRFRQVVADYVADIAARTAANDADGGTLTDAEIRSAAVKKIKEDINDGVTYAELNLPNTPE